MKRLLLSTAIFITMISAQTAQAGCIWPEGETPTEREIAECMDGEVFPDNLLTIGTIMGTTDSDFSPASILTSAEIENRNPTYIADILRSIPGVSVNRSGPGGGLTQIRMRGSEASHVLILIDGVEVANPTAGEFDLSGLRAGDIENIEVLRGEQSALHGPDAIGGVISITTKAGGYAPYWEASVEAGSFGTVDGQISAVVPLGYASLAISAGALSTEGYDISGLDKITGDAEKDGSESRSLSIGLNRVRIGGVTLSAKYGGSYLSTEFDEDLFFSGRLDDTNSLTKVATQTARVDAKFDVAGFENLITLSGHDITTDSRASFPSVSDGTRRKARWAIKKGFDNHAITVLGETERETYAITPSFAFAPTRPENKSYAVAGDYRYTSDSLSVTGSARQDFNDRFDDAFTWKLVGTYNLDSFGGRVRASVGTGVKNPSLIELFGFYPETNFIGNPDLKPEQSFGYNIGYTQELIDGDLKLGADYFRSDLTDEIYSDFSAFPFLPRNRTTDSKREGVELTADWDNGGIVSLYGSATFLDADENGTPEIRRPEFLASVTATINASDDLSFTGSLDHTGSQLDTDFSTFSVVTLDAFTLAGLNAAYTVNDIITLTLRGENLFDEQYQEVVGYSSQGRGVFAGLRARFD